MTFTANSQGGEYKHVLTLDEIPKHEHRVFVQNTWGSPQITAPKWAIAFPNDWKQYEQETTLLGVGTTKEGADAGHNILSPYVAIYYWKRIA